MAKAATRKGVDKGRARAQSPVASPASVGQTRTLTDWEAVERAYRAGVLSIREIAKQHGCSHVAIQKRAKKEGWARDLTAKVRQAVTTALVTKEVTAETKATEREIVAEAAATCIAVVRGHRADIGRGRRIAEKLIEQLEWAADHRDELEAAIEEETREAENPDASKGAQQRAWAKRGQMLRCVSLPQHVTTLKEWTTALKTLVGLEREAFNLGSAPPDDPDEPGQGAAIAMQALDTVTERIAQRLAHGNAQPAGA